MLAKAFESKQEMIIIKYHREFSDIGYKTAQV